MNNRTQETGGRILFADDDLIFREGMADVLGDLGFECRCVSSVKEAMECLTCGDFDVLLTDSQMVGNHNMEFIQNVAELYPTLPILLLTGMPARETMMRSAQLPVMACLVKPQDTGELITLLHRAVRENRSRQLVGSSRERSQPWNSELRGSGAQLKPRATRRDDSAAGYVQLTLRNTIQALVDLERSISVLCNEREPEVLRQTELVSALRNTVTVLAKTKQNFKSKDLGELRQNLERLLETHE